MKKILLLTICALMLCVSWGCKEEDKCDIECRISSLEDAINTPSYSAYMACFDDSASYQSSYTPGQFASDYDGSIQYAFGALTINGNTVTCTSTKNSVGSYPNTFEVTDTDDNCYIIKWTEDGVTIFEKK